MRRSPTSSHLSWATLPVRSHVALTVDQLDSPRGCPDPSQVVAATLVHE